MQVLVNVSSSSNNEESLSAGRSLDGILGGSLMEANFSVGLCIFVEETPDEESQCIPSCWPEFNTGWFELLSTEIKRWKNF